MFKDDAQWNALFQEPPALSVEYVHSLRSALLLRISEVIRHEKERGTASSLQAASAASVESYIRFLKIFIKGIVDRMDDVWKEILVGLEKHRFCCPILPSFFRLRKTLSKGYLKNRHPFGIVYL